MQTSGVGERIKKWHWNSNGPGSTGPKSGAFQEFFVGFGERQEKRQHNNLLDIARALGVSLDYLMTGEASQDQNSEVPIPASLAKFAAEEGLTSGKH